MKQKVGRPDWAVNIENVLAEIEENEQECENIAVEPYCEFAKASFAIARKKYESEMQIYQRALDDGFVVVDTLVNLPFEESCGLRLSKFFRALRDETKILAIRCAECKRVIFPPRPVCGFCRISVGERDDDWLSLSDKGTIISIILATEREVDRKTAKIIGKPNPCAFIRLEGGDNWTVLVHYLDMVDPKYLEAGLKVEAVWRPREERKGRMSDIDYFRIIRP
jgi:uncharacterized OB-fold protein